MKFPHAIATALLLLAPFARAQSPAITYQGRLADGGAPANGSYNLRFTLHDDATAGLQYGPSLTNAAVDVADGYFLVTLDFGPGAFNGGARWLQIGVRTNGSVSAHTLLSPRQAVASVPYAIQSLTASNVLGNINDAQISGNIARLNAPASFNGQVTFNSGLNAPFKVVNPSLVTNLNADLLDGLDSSSFALSNHTHSAADVTSGQLNDARLSINIPLLNRGQTFSGTNIFGSQVIATNASNNFAGIFSGNGGGLSNLNSSFLTGLLPDASLPTTLARLGSNQTFSGTAIFNPAGGAPFRVGSATLVTNLNSDLLDGLNSTAFWGTAGNTNPGATLFLGTTDKTPLEFRANNQRALRLETGALAPSVIGGAAGNSISAGISGAVVGGGGPANSVIATYGVVAGGTGNSVSGLYGVVGGGQNNSATNSSATVPGGSGNLAGGVNSLAAGQNAQALHAGALVWSDTSTLNTFTSTAPNTVIFRSTGGVGINTNSPQAALHVAGVVQADGLKFTAFPQNGALLVSDAVGNANWQPAPVRSLINAISPNLIGGYSNNTVAAGIAGATVAGGGAAGASNYVGGNFGTVGGGQDNSASGVNSTIAGGTQNRATQLDATVGGGVGNFATNTYATVGGGGFQMAGGSYATVSGGLLNQSLGSGATVGGGYFQLASGQESAIGGGNANIAAGTQSFIGGGMQNRASNTYSAILGGFLNTNSGFGGVIGGGFGNIVANTYATIPGGSGNYAGGLYSFAAGRNARAAHDGSFVWADNSSASTLPTTAANQFLIRAAGGLFLSGTASDTILNIQGDTRIFDNDILLRTTNDYNHGLGWYGSGKTWGGVAIDGPVLYGSTGGALATAAGQKIALYWNNSQLVGIGTNAPQQNLSVAAGMNIDQANGNVGTAANTLRFGSASGEAIGSRRSGSPNLNGLDFYANGLIRLSIENGGNVGIGTADPNDRLEVVAPDAALRLKNSNDGGLGGFIENTFGSLQLGMYSESNNVNQVSGATKRAFLGFNSSGQVGSLVNSPTSPNAPSFRNLLDDGAGNLGVGTTSPQARVHAVASGQMAGRFDSSNTGGTWLNLGNSSSGGATWSMISTGSGNGEGAGKLLFFSSVAGSMRMQLDGSGNLFITGTYSPSSDRNVKKDFADVNAREILARVAELPLKTWAYTNDAAVRHIGPMAQDFSRAFGVGMDDKHIATVDADGVALAAIQGLNQVVEEKQAEIRELKRRNDALESRLSEVEKLVRQLAANPPGH